MPIVSTAAELRPLVHELPRDFDPAEAFRRIRQRGHCLFLDSARRSAELGRYSFLAADPFKVVTVDVGQSRPWRQLAAAWERYRTTTLPELPPFQGGAAGLWSYGLARSLERIPANRFDEFHTPALHVGLYDVVVATDHQQGRSWIVSQGFPETHPRRRQRRAEERVRQVLGWLDAPPASAANGPERLLNEADMAPLHSTPYEGVSSNFSRDDYCRTVQRVIDYIHAGDVFQVNLSQRLVHRAATDSASLYLALREHNPAPFAAYFDLGSQQVLSASPERFLRVSGRHVEARPIKGTRPRTSRPEADLFAAAELRASAKDVAENVMIVDLMRNDLSRVCEDDSVRVTQLCELEVYQYVQHLVSTIHGTLRAESGPWELLHAAFPGGSITGAPKVRAMEIIAELEPTARGPYCGSIGYLGFDGALDLNILIRTITASRGWWQFPVGGGIVAESQPAKEYAETWHKAGGMLQAIAACSAAAAAHDGPDSEPSP